ncbi:MAG TPA: glycosyltransferase family 39 protein [Chloroflexota bacterium]|nr:glycosyltransferase family 39 protein [Chloroflexota bacterium]
MRELVGAVLGLWGTVNHYLTFWPRLRVALGVVVVLAVALGAGGALLLRVRPGRLRVGRLVFVGTFLLMVASGGGHLYTPDEWTIYAAAVGLVEHGVPAAFRDEPYPLHVLGRPARADGQSDEERGYAFSKYGVTPTLLAAPVYALARVVGPGPDLPAQAFPYGNLALPLVPLTLGPTITALTTALLLDVARRLGYPCRAAMIAAAGVTFGSLSWVYSKTLMNMPLTALFLLGGYWATLRARAEGTRRWGVLTGAALGAAIATRYEAVLFCVPIVAVALLDIPRSRRRAEASRVAAGAAALVVPLVLGMNWLRTGSPVDPGYGGEGGLSSLAEKPWFGLFGIVFSPGCGLATLTPLMAVGLLSLVWLWEDAPAGALVAGSICAGALLYYGSLVTWCGSLTWGPRYLVTVGPFMALPLASMWSRLRRPGHAARNPFLWLAGGGLFAWSAGTNLLAVLIDFNRGWQDHWGHGVTYLEVTWLPFFSGPVAHWRLLTREWLMDGIGGLDLYLWHVPLGPLWVALLVGVGLACWGLAWRSGYDEAAPGSASTSL